MITDDNNRYPDLSDTLLDVKEPMRRPGASKTRATSPQEKISSLDDEIADLKELLGTPIIPKPNPPSPPSSSLDSLDDEIADIKDLLSGNRSTGKLTGASPQPQKNSTDVEKMLAELDDMEAVQNRSTRRLTSPHSAETSGKQPSLNEKRGTGMLASLNEKKATGPLSVSLNERRTTAPLTSSLSKDRLSGEQRSELHARPLRKKGDFYKWNDTEADSSKNYGIIVAGAVLGFCLIASVVGFIYQYKTSQVEKTQRNLAIVEESPYGRQKQLGSAEDEPILDLVRKAAAKSPGSTVAQAMTSYLNGVKGAKWQPVGWKLESNVVKFIWEEQGVSKEASWQVDATRGRVQPISEDAIKIGP